MTQEQGAGAGAFCYCYLLLLLLLLLLLGLISEEIDFFVLASLAMKLREYTRNTPIRRNPVSKF